MRVYFRKNYFSILNNKKVINKNDNLGNYVGTNSFHLGTNSFHLGTNSFHFRTNSFHLVVD